MVNNRLQENKNFQKIDITVNIDKLIEHTYKIGYFDWIKDGNHQFEFITGDDEIKDKYWCKNEYGKDEQVYKYILEESDKSKKNLSWSVGVKKIYDYDETYFKEIYDLLSKKYKLGRMRLLTIRPMTSLSWHREPDDRIIIPITTNPGSHLIIENENKHLPVDGSVWFCKTTKYHSGFNGGRSNRVHLVISCNGEI